MVFNLSVAINNLTDSKRNYAILISDTVIVDSEKNNCLTLGVLRGISDISYSFKDNEAVQPLPPSSRRRPNAQINKNIVGRTEHQAELRKKKLEEIKARGIVSNNKVKKVQTIDLDKYETYRSLDEFPKELKKNCIFVDFKRYAALLPVCGAHLPVHACLIKNISKIE
jgi:nucleosome binding factor SPN SPT16 subunit